MEDEQAEQGPDGLIPGAIVSPIAFASFSFWSRDLGTFQGFLAGIFFLKKAFHRDRTLTGVEGGSAPVGLSRERAETLARVLCVWEPPFWLGLGVP